MHFAGSIVVPEFVADPLRLLREQHVEDPVPSGGGCTSEGATFHFFFNGSRLRRCGDSSQSAKSPLSRPSHRMVCQS